MRSEAEIKNLLLDFSKQDDRIRAVLLNGSRANPNIKTDRLQDFDIVFIVDNLESFTIDHSWINIFGEKIIFQLPDEMTFGDKGNYQEKISFTYLILFKDRNRIDLTLFPKEKIKNFNFNGPSILWLDKDNLFFHPFSVSDRDYHIQKPTEKEFSDTCNEFWWVSTYVAKGLLRSEITYAKEMTEIVVRPMFMKIIEWKIGVENDFSVSFGKAGRFMRKYLSENFYIKILQTYSNYKFEDNWKSLFVMADIFRQTSNQIAKELGFQINRNNQNNTMEYLKQEYYRQNLREER